LKENGEYLLLIAAFGTGPISLLKVTPRVYYSKGEPFFRIKKDLFKKRLLENGKPHAAKAACAVWKGLMRIENLFRSRHQRLRVRIPFLLIA
jgi:hypothetical protein